VPRGLFEWAVVVTAVAVTAANVGAYLNRGDGGSPEHHVLASVKKVTPPPPATVWEPPAAPSKAYAFAFVAARGDSWLSVHAGSFRGRVLYEGLLHEGEHVRLRARRLWVRFGGASDFDVYVNGRRAKLPLFGTYDAYVTRRGIRPDPTLYATSAQSP
jgi:hypothetical protein